MFKKINKMGKYAVSKITKFIFKKAFRWTFWGLFAFYGPGPIIATVGVRGLITGAVILYSGVLEYTANKTISNVINL